MHTVLWKNLHSPGHDACRFADTPDGWLIEGAAVFAHDTAPARLFYRLHCDPDWSSLRASVTGWIGDQTIDISIMRRHADRWLVNGRIENSLAGLRDIDLGFTPSSNTSALRRLDIAIGDKVETVSVWLDPESWAVKPLPQSYQRLRADAYDYASPLHDYRATLLVDEFGAVTSYPGLWTQVLP